MKAYCRSIEGALDCDSSDSWLPVGNAVKTAHGRRASVYLVLSLQVKGFRNPFLATSFTVNRPIGWVTFVFQTSCVGDCGFYFLERPRSVSRPIILAEWNGTVSRRSYNFPVLRSSATVFEWVFIRSQLTDSQFYRMEDIALDEATIFLINVTNTVDGGASTCSSCARDDEFE
ncbi:unnamed protein product [Soboliphyme baturini]|uniref:MAM domain-containing protein n=1 Tax=Soboliphyme baturini TaxID=241478 RepID=A0A183JAZ5_9BILA|nr:unnamed protein product [Soboliphyme baturini]